MNLNDGDNILKRIKEVIGSAGVNFSVLEHQIDVKVQVEYFEFSKNQPLVKDADETINEEPKLYADDIDFEKKQQLLVSLASIDKPEAYRVIERFASKVPPELKDWTMMALQENRMLLESRLLDEQQIFISTGLGGKGSKLRYFIAIFSESKQNFTDTQKKLIKGEMELSLKRFQCEIEEIDFHGNYASIISLIPLNVHVREPFQMAIDECNALGEFIQGNFLITNVKVMNKDEIKDIVESSNTENDLDLEI